MSFELGNDGPTLILAGVDGSRTSMRAAAYAVGLARRQDAGVLLAHVTAPSALVALTAEAGALYQQAREELSVELREQILTGVQDLGVRAEFVALSGDPYDQLVRLADERRVEAVVVGASESAGHRLVGSLALRLVRAARWPVTVVP